MKESQDLRGCPGSPPSVSSLCLTVEGTAGSLEPRSWTEAGFPLCLDSELGKPAESGGKGVVVTLRRNAEN